MRCQLVGDKQLAIDFVWQARSWPAQDEYARR